MVCTGEGPVPAPATPTGTPQTPLSHPHSGPGGRGKPESFPHYRS